MPVPKHLPLDLWPDADRRAFDMAFAPGDRFDGTCGPGAHLAQDTRRIITTGYRRWLGYLYRHHPKVLELEPAKRITLARVRAFIEHLEPDMRSTSVAFNVRSLHSAALLIAPATDWGWLRAIAARLLARSMPQDRFSRLVPNEQLLDLGLQLMEEAIEMVGSSQRVRATLFRDGLIIALLSLWPIRRRAVKSLTVSRHVRRDEDGITLVLYEEDTKSGRSEHLRLPDVLLAHFQQYLDEIRPAFPNAAVHDGLWASNKGGPLSGVQIYNIVRHHTAERLGKPVGLHDIRRSAGTFMAIDAPELASLIAGVLQHANQETSEKHYILARSVEASRRHASTIAKLRRELPIRPRQIQQIQE